MSSGKGFFLLALLVAFPCLGSEEADFSGRIGVEAGIHEDAASGLKSYQYSRMVLSSYRDLSGEISLELAGEARWQSSMAALAPAWPLFPRRNLLDLEAQEASSGGEGFATLRLARAALHFASGPLDVAAGLVKQEWGVASFFRPADHFFPTPPLLWDGELPLASEALDAKCFLFDDLSIEAAGRLLEGGAGDWVVRLVDKSVAYTVVPSLARVGGRGTLGLELLATFPDFQVWGEGSCGLDASGPGEPLIRRFSGILGFSFVVDGTTYSLEAFKDGTGTILGAFSSGRRDAAYFFASGEKKFPGEWAVRAGLVKSSCGGPFLLWPKLAWGFDKNWEALLQAQVPLGSEPGALALLPARVGISVNYNF